MRKLFFLSILCMLWGSWACTDEAETPIIVTTEDALFVGGDKIRISGRLLTNREVTASDHGFIISESEAFGSSITVSLGSKEGPGRFIGEAEGLKISQTYWVKAFSIVDGQELLGQAVRIQMLTPQVESFSPKFAKIGDNITLTGRNIPAGSKVFFGAKEAQIVSNQFESRIVVKVPSADNNPLVPIRIEVQGKPFQFVDLFEYQSGKFTKVINFPAAAKIYNGIYFYNANGFHVGLGQFQQGEINSKIVRFNPSSGDFTEISFPGKPRINAFATPNYMGGGSVEVAKNLFENERSFYKIDGSSFTRLNDLPFFSINQVSAEINGDLYLLGGPVSIGSTAPARIVWKYSSASNSWAQLPSAPFNISSKNPFFTYQGKIYVTTSSGEIYEFDPIANTWTEKAVYPGHLGQGFGIAQVLGSKAYIGLYSRSQEIWELDLNTFSWKVKNPIGGLPQSINAGHFVYNGAIYFLRGPEISVFGELPFELYKFEPNAL